MIEDGTGNIVVDTLRRMLLPNWPYLCLKQETGTEEMQELVDAVGLYQL